MGPLPHLSAHSSLDSCWQVLNTRVWLSAPLQLTRHIGCSRLGSRSEQNQSSRDIGVDRSTFLYRSAEREL